MKILIVEDHEIIAKNIAQFLKIEGYITQCVGSAEHAKKELEKDEYNLILLDINLPGINGVDFCKLLREEGSKVAIIILTSSNTQKDIIYGLKSGADDYIAKPFDYDELLLRIQSLLRRSVLYKKSYGNTHKIGNIEINYDKKQVIYNNTCIYLSTLEYRLYEYLSKNRGKVISRNELYEEVWGEYEARMFSRTVDVYVNYIRKKLGKNSIQTRKGEGYYID